MSSTNLEDFSEIDFVRAAESPPSHQQWAHSELRAGASPEQRTDGDQGCRNACVRDDNPVDCKTLSVRRRLAEDLGCCGCTRAPETPCLVTDEDASTSCCQQRRPVTPARRPETNDSAACGAVDPVQQIIEEGLQRHKKRHHGRRQSSSRSDRPRRPCNGSERPSDRRGSYQPDYFDDQADMNNWQQHRDRSRRDEPRQRPSSPPPRPKSLAFEPYVDTEPYSPARPSTPGAPVRPQRQTENPQDLRRDMLLELQRLDEQRAELLQSMERERKMVEMVLEHQRQKRGSCPAPAPAAGPCDDRQRIQRRIDEAKQKTAELQRRYQQQQQQQQPSSSDGQCSAPATGCPTPSTGQRRKLHYQPPSPDTDDECCAPPPPQRRLLKYNPPSSDSSDDDCGNAAGACNRSTAGDDRPSSLQDSSVYYNRSSRSGVPRVTADVPQQTSSLWTNP
ncbi:Uncharacterized protein FWK35_00023120 [Aphis craccivora]|uniref:Uncharacterized protein n=1 Tax=Aphis craccivora TaxID=307492 RepID=A0A6G0Y3N4_APHCR|nr:Uncharacterized protein FWK35_00023120 [Aphis craccivora]